MRRGELARILYQDWQVLRTRLFGSVHAMERRSRGKSPEKWAYFVRMSCDAVAFVEGTGPPAGLVTGPPPEGATSEVGVPGVGKSSSGR